MRSKELVEGLVSLLREQRAVGHRVRSWDLEGPGDSAAGSQAPDPGDSVRLRKTGRCGPPLSLGIGDEKRPNRRTKGTQI